VAGSEGPVTVIADGHSTDATVVTFDPARDFALLALARSSLPALTLEIKALDPQTPVLTVGHPDAQTALDVGPARVVDQKFIEMADPYGRPVNRATMLLSTANHVRPGSSGGAVIDTAGEVVGVIFAGPHAGTGYALAIPSEEIVPDVNRATFQPVSAGGCEGLQN
jgi:S1-C subfamily serine protease